MSGTKSPIEEAYYHAIANRTFSAVYAALNGGVEEDYRETFRKEWRKRGSYLLIELLRRCVRPDWNSYPETFWIDPWTAKFLLASEPGSLFYFADAWLDGESLPREIDTDPRVEDDRIRELHRLFSALNR